MSFALWVKWMTRATGEAPISMTADQYKLFGAQIQGRFYFDTVLAMGCRSSCRIFEQFSKALVWILNNKFGIQRVTHMIDDFLFVEPTKERCYYAMEVFRNLDGRIGVPLGPEKTVGASYLADILRV